MGCLHCPTDFINLRVDRAHGAAPNKLILLLAILELIEQGQIRENIIPSSPSLFEIFMKYWSIVTDRRPNLALPFFHLKSEGFWHHQANAGYETALRVTTQIKTVSRLQEIIAHASLDGELLLCSPLHITERYSVKRSSIPTSQSTSKQLKVSSQKQNRLAYTERNCSDAWNTPFQRKTTEHPFKLKNQFVQQVFVKQSCEFTITLV